jgi:hypothetical protein
MIDVKNVRQETIKNIKNEIRRNLMLCSESERNKFVQIYRNGHQDWNLEYCIDNLDELHIDSAVRQINETLKNYH